MDNLGDWIYILFILIAFITSVLKPKKRLQKADRPLTPAYDPIEPASPVYAEKKPGELRETLRRTEIPSRIPPKRPAEFYKSHIKASDLPKKAIQTDSCYQLDENAYDECEETEVFRNNADLRKAIIAGEILGRKF